MQVQMQMQMPMQIVSEIPLAGPLCLLNGRALSIYSSLARTRFNL